MIKLLRLCLQQFHGVHLLIPYFNTFFPPPQAVNQGNALRDRKNKARSGTVPLRAGEPCPVCGGGFPPEATGRP
jgi:hypothetical protein